MKVKVLLNEEEIHTYTNNAVMPIPRIGEYISIHGLKTTFEVESVDHIFASVNDKHKYEVKLRVKKAI